MSTKKSVILHPLRFRQNVMMGCDPEFFFFKGNKVVGSEKVLPKEGLETNDSSGSKIVIDGVQAEINPAPSNCRESLAYYIFTCFLKLRKQIDIKDVKIQTDAVVNISQEELDSLSEGSRQFGCAPSTNIYNEGADKTSKISANPAKYLKRSAGGHIHLGNGYEGYLNNGSSYQEIAKSTEKTLKEMPEIMVPMLDIIVGNTCVLLDRNEENVERRKNYGRVGEYRLKPYGIEYRTLSNFWLRSYPLMSFVFGMARLAVHLVEQSTKECDYVKAIFDVVPREDIVAAVQKNDFDLAMKNFKKIEPLISQMTSDGHWPLSGEKRLAYFYQFVNRIAEKGLEYWFPEDAFMHWSDTTASGQYTYNTRGGWECFADNVIILDLNKKQSIDLSTNKKVGVVA